MGGRAEHRAYISTLNSIMNFRNSSPAGRHLRLFTFWLLVFAFGSSASGQVFVDAQAPGPGNDGSSWAKALPSVQAAIEAAAISGEDVWVAAGTYEEKLTLREGVRLFGGFTGFLGAQETQRDDRDFELNPTIIDARNARTGSADDHAVTIQEVNQIRIDGFTITGGGAEPGASSGPSQGGGVFLTEATGIAIANCAIVNNGALAFGGGVFASFSSLEIVNCTIGNNVATSGGGLYLLTSSANVRISRIIGNSATEGAGVYCSRSSPTIDQCVISGNRGGSASFGGGVQCVSESSPTLTRTIVSGNFARAGGGIYCTTNSSPTLINCIVSGNSAISAGGLPTQGGALAGRNRCAPRLINCTIANNKADGVGGAIHSGDTQFNPILINCILAGNSPYAFYESTEDADPQITNSLFFANSPADYFDEGSLAGGVGVDLTGADAINALAEAEGILDGDPLLTVGPGGTWTEPPLYFPDDNVSLLTDSDASLEPGALAGYLLNGAVDQSHEVYILSNTATTMTVVGMVLDFIDAGRSYVVMEYRLGFGSAAIDTGTASGAPQDDFGSRPRPIDIPGFGFEGSGLEFDVGAYEFQIEELPPPPNAARLWSLYD